MPAHPQVVIRPAAPGELSAAAHVYLLADDEPVEGQPGAPSRVGTAEGARIEADAYADLVVCAAEGPERVLVAVAGGEVVGVAAWRVWETWWFLGYLFVLPGWQGRGIGKDLLERAWAGGVAAGCTHCSLFASQDPRAIKRYLALGLLPQPPMLSLQVDGEALLPPPLPWDDGLVAHPLGPDEPDPALLGTLGDLDRVVRGARRPADLLRWLRAGATGALLTAWESGKPAGYYLLDLPPPGGSERGRIGPIVALDVERVPTIVSRALAAAVAHGRPEVRWRLTLPGQNGAAIGPLFAAGFRPRSFSNYLANGAIGRWERYIPRNEDDL